MSPQVDRQGLRGEFLASWLDGCAETGRRLTAEMNAAFEAGVEQGRREATAEAARRIRAAALREYADRHHPHAEGVEQRVDTLGVRVVEYDAVCAGCGASWVDEEGGCTERAQLLADAATIERVTDG